MRRKKTTVIIVMCVAMVLMAVGYAILSTRLTINGSTAVTSSWRVEFSAIRTTSTVGGATNAITPTVNATTASFEVDLVQPGDSITYEIDITNYGDIVAEVKGATYEATGSEAIYVEIEGIQKGTLIGSCEGLSTCPSVTATVTVGYNPNVTSDPEYKNKEIRITLDIGQYVSSSPVEAGELIPELSTTLVTDILNNNTEIADGNVDFNDSDVEAGLYYTSTNTEGNKVTYYFRGDVVNNYVRFAGILWRIVRINEDGSVRLITNDAVGSSSYNNSNKATDDNAYLGYMYGMTSAASYSLAHTNTYDSELKDFLDSWYTSNLASYSSYISTEAGFCNDRSIDADGESWHANDTALGYGVNVTYYGAYNRIANDQQPQFACPQTADLFTPTTSTQGNKKLTNPIGAITMDEIYYAGSVSNGSSGWLAVTDNYLYDVGSAWTMTPLYFDGTYSYVGRMAAPTVRPYATYNSFAVAPVINVKGDVKILTGSTGTATNPYVIR